MYPNTFITMLEETTSECINKYNQVELGNELETNVHLIERIIEKPKNPTSNITSIGRYVLSPDIFEVIPAIEQRNNEFYLTDAFDILTKSNRFIGAYAKIKRYDIGNKKSWLETNIEFSKGNSEFE